MKTIIIVVGITAVLLIGIVWLSSRGSNDSDVIAKGGIHWHPHLEIIVKGEKVEIPPNIGLGPTALGKPTYSARMGMTAMHTHEADGVIHLEFPGIVREEDLRLGNFFIIWGKDPASFGQLVSAKINGQENPDWMNHMMADGDTIELRYE